MSKKVAVIGLGYVGFPLVCAIVRSKKFEVIGYDICKDKIEMIQRGVCPIDDLQAKIDLKELSITVTCTLSSIADANMYIVCVPTPVDSMNYPDLSPLKMVSNDIAPLIKKGNAIIIESTINPGICEEIIQPILETGSNLKAGVDFDLAHCPERINPGDEKWNVYNIPRNVGASTLAGGERIADFYRSFINANINVLGSLKEVEATKIVENTFRDINIAFVNELAMSFDKLNINVVNVIKGAANKPFGFLAHYPGCGVGGHCIAVDPYYLIEKAKSVGFDHKFLRVARKVNSGMPKYTVEKLVKSLNSKGLAIKSTSIGLLGLSYKSNVGDMRESPALVIKKILIDEYESSDLKVFDPYFPDESNVSTLDKLLHSVKAIIIATDHNEFLSIDFGKYSNLEVIVDGRNCIDVGGLPISYTGIGRS